VVEAIKFLWKHFEERNWKRKESQKHLNFWGTWSIIHKTWASDVEAKAVKFL